MKSAIFTQEFNFTPKGEGVGFNVKPSPEPQTRRADLIDAALKAGAAKAVPRAAKKRG